MLCWCYEWSHWRDMTSRVEGRREVSQAQKWEEDLECRSWVRNSGQEELKELLQQQGKCWWEQIILGHIKRNWIYPKVNEGFEAGMGKKLQEPMNISKSYSIQWNMNWRLRDWKLKEQLEIAPGRKWWCLGLGWWVWRQSIPGLKQECGSWAGQIPLWTDISLTQKFVLKLLQSQGLTYAWLYLWIS